MEIVDTDKSPPLARESLAAAVADPYARKVLAACIRKARAVKDISQEAQLPLPTTYRQVNRLCDSGVLVVERSAMTPDGKRYELYRSRVKSIRLELDASGERVLWEVHEPREERLAGLWDTLRKEASRP